MLKIFVQTGKNGLFITRYAGSCRPIRQHVSSAKTKFINESTTKPDEMEVVSAEELVNSIAVPVKSKATVDASLRSALSKTKSDETASSKVTKLPWLPSPYTEPAVMISQYKKLAKFRLTSLVVITAMGGYAMAPAAFDPTTFLLCSLGTGLVSAAANAINQYHEVPFDSQMSRTKNRVLVTGQLTPLHAIGFATVSAASGLCMLYFGVNGLTAMLGAGNLILYTSIYTPMKRMSIFNTWVGSIVGSIPPLMGWAGCTGSLDAGAWLLAGVLYAWQFPHFNALSWNLRPDYSRAGYRMMAVTNPDLCRRTALRYTFGITGLSLVAPVLDVTNAWFALETLPLNAYFCYLAYRFHQKSDSGSSRKLFRFSLVHLPALMLLFLFNKKHWYCSEITSEETANIIDKTNVSVPTTPPKATGSTGLSMVLPVAIAATSTEIETSMSPAKQEIRL